MRVQDLLLESVASILNLSARRIGKADERDLEQARVGIEAVRAVVDLLDEGPREQVREALSQVQMLYAARRRGRRGASGGGRRGAAGAARAEPRPRAAARASGPRARLSSYPTPQSDSIATVPRASRPESSPAASRLNRPLTEDHT